MVVVLVLVLRVDDGLVGVVTLVVLVLVVVVADGEEATTGALGRT